MRRSMIALSLLGILAAAPASAQSAERRTDAGRAQPTAPDRLVATPEPAAIQGRCCGSVYGGILPGRAVDGSGRPVAGARLVLTSSSERSVTVTTGPDGRFSAEGLAAGDYVVSAEQRSLTAVEADPEGGVLVRIAANPPAVAGRHAPRHIRFAFRFSF